jgi:hypothetical protein
MAVNPISYRTAPAQNWATPSDVASTIVPNSHGEYDTDNGPVDGRTDSVENNGDGNYFETAKTICDLGKRKLDRGANDTADDVDCSEQAVLRVACCGVWLLCGLSAAHCVGTSKYSPA